MIDWIIELLLPVTFVLAFLLVMHNQTLKYLGASSSYLTWLLLPLTILFYSLPMPWDFADSETFIQIQQYVVTSQKQVQVLVNINWLLTIWMMGISLFVGYFVIGHLLFSRQLNLKKIDLVSVSASMPVNLPLFQSPQAYSPMLVGVLNQKLIIPEEFQSLYNKEQQTLILEHEICHFERNDMYWNLLAMACLAILWFHPLAWLGYFRFRRDQELSCDQLVLARKQTESRINYSKALLVAAESTPPIAFAQLSFKKYGEKNTMFERIKQIKLNTKASGSALSLVSLLAITLLSGVSFAGNFDKQKSADIEPTISVKPLMRVEPLYPKTAAEDKAEGSVLLQYDITAQGNVENVKVIKSEPERIFDQAAKIAVAQWKYETSKYGSKGNMLQLDFALSEGYSKNLMGIVERVKIAKN